METMSSHASAARAPIRSMTGYALVRRQTSAGELAVSLRTVNHRGLDIHFHSAGELAEFENALRTVLKDNVARGHVELRVSLSREAGNHSAPPYNRGLLAHYLEVFRAANQEFHLSSEPDLNTVFTFPGVLDAAGATKAPDSALGEEAVAALTACVGELNAFREREGAQLVRAMDSEIQAMEHAVIQISGVRARALQAFHERLRGRLAELLANSSLTETRLAEEAALLADRSDVQEELTRLEVHTAELRRILAAGGEIGKRVDFLMQEMNRETNTILSKSSGAGEIGIVITNLGLGIKANIERIREQALNLE
jgi:uncharacterized protein (TIGR00255 family)